MFYSSLFCNKHAQITLRERKCFFKVSKFMDKPYIFEVSCFSEKKDLKTVFLLLFI